MTQPTYAPRREPNMTDPSDLRMAVIRSIVEGRRVIRVEGDGARLILDNDTVLYLYMSDSDCCASANGTWVIDPDHLEAIITDVKVTPDAERSDPVSEYGETTNYATVSILHNQNPIALADCYANDGNGGYYFSVLSLAVTVQDQKIIEMAVVES